MNNYENLLIKEKVQNFLAASGIFRLFNSRNSDLQQPF